EAEKLKIKIRVVRKTCEDASSSPITNSINLVRRIQMGTKRSLWGYLAETSSMHWGTASKLLVHASWDGKFIWLTNTSNKPMPSFFLIGMCKQTFTSQESDINAICFFPNSNILPLVCMMLLASCLNARQIRSSQLTPKTTSYVGSPLFPSLRVDTSCSQGTMTYIEMSLKAKRAGILAGVTTVSAAKS
ncbi:Guanine nucleotide-binding protein G(I)/G(S)/G(T) subunit beta-1, partial [Galemys pyrenaicus]